MTRLVLITLLVLSSGPVYAECVRVSADNQGKMTAYVDPSTIRRKAGVVEMWEIVGLQESTSLGERLGFI